MFSNHKVLTRVKVQGVVVEVRSSGGFVLKVLLKVSCEVAVGLLDGDVEVVDRKQVVASVAEK